MAARLSPSRIIFVVTVVVVLAYWFSVSPFLDHHQSRSYAGRSGGLLDNINNATFGFEEILVVSLPTRTDRRDGMLLQASLSEAKVKFIDAVLGKNIPDNAIPTLTKHPRIPDASVGSWRAHMNAIYEVVARNLSSALILEDDVDWDVRIHSQLRDFALSAHALIQPLAGTNAKYADPTLLQPKLEEGSTVADISFNSLPRTEAPINSPYGDDWDLLWVGHCGMRFPQPTNHKTPKGRVIHLNDETVAEKRYLWSIINPFSLVDDYPQHTRAVSHTEEGVCSLGYAISQQGARKLLLDVGLKDVDSAFDILLRFFCNGGPGRNPHRCLTVQPSLFHHFRAAGPIAAESDIGDHGDGFREHALTDMVRWSVRLNAETIMNHGTVFHDQYPNSDVV